MFLRFHQNLRLDVLIKNKKCMKANTESLAAVVFSHLYAFTVFSGRVSGGEGLKECDVLLSSDAGTRVCLYWN